MLTRGIVSRKRSGFRVVNYGHNSAMSWSPPAYCIRAMSISFCIARQILSVEIVDLERTRQLDPKHQAYGRDEPIA